MRLYVFILTVFFACLVQASDLRVQYDVSLDLTDFAQRQYPQTLQATITNDSDVALDHLVWMFYPNRYQKKLPNINDVNLHRIYPHGFSAGSLDLRQMAVDDQMIDAHTLTALDQERYGQVFMRQTLPSPLQPGQTVQISMQTILQVPHKYGSFGWYRKQLTLSGGWSPVLVSFENGTFHPSYQMPVADWSVHINGAQDLQLAMPEDLSHGNSFELKQARQVSLKVGNIKSFRVEKNGYVVDVFHRDYRKKSTRKPFEKMIDHFANFLQARNLNQRMSYTLVQAPLREMLVVDGTPISYFSDRAFKVPTLLHHYHEIPIYKALFMQLYEQALSTMEHEKDLFWVQEVVAWRLTEELVQSLEIKHRDARQIGILQMLKFFPLVDRVLYTPQFAFYDVFYNLVYPKDYVRDEVRRYPNRQPFGQTILAHMEDEFGKEKTVALIDAYIAALPKEGFRAFASSYMGKDLSMRFEQWVTPRPQINYKLGRHRKKKVGLQYKHAITIEQETAASIIEPVTLKVTFKDKTYQTQQWFSTEKKHTFELITDQKIKAIEIDPQERLLETSKSDNRRPAYWKFVILSMFVEYDFEEQQPLFMIFGQLRKRYGGLDRFDMGGYSQFNSYGANFGYTRLFGKAIDALRLSHGVRFALNLNGLAQDVALVQTSPDPTIIQVTDSGYASDVSVSYVYGNQLSYINPLQGMYGGLTLRVSNPLLGSQYSYRMINFNTAGIVQLHPNHLWGIRFSIGSSGAGEMPSQLQYRLGGIASMRGLPLTNDKFSGKHIVLLTNEYRHFLSQDMDLNLGLFRIRKIQGALFSNVGNTTHTVQEQADRKAGLITDVSGFMDLFDPRDLKADVGYGLRLHIHYFGVSPSLISFDVARSITEKGYGYLYYLGVNQTF